MSALERALESMYRQVSARFESEAAARAWVNDMRRAFIDPCVDEAVTAERHRCAAIANGIGNVARRNSAAGSAERLVEDATQCPRCHGPRDSHSGCDHCRERAITDVQPRPEVLR